MKKQDLSPSFTDTQNKISQVYQTQKSPVITSPVKSSAHKVNKQNRKSLQTNSVSFSMSMTNSPAKEESKMNEAKPSIFQKPDIHKSQEAFE